MKERVRSEVLKLLLWIGALLALPVLIIGSFPVDPGSIQINWAIYFFAVETVLIIVIVALFIYKRMRRSSPVIP